LTARRFVGAGAPDRRGEQPLPEPDTDLYRSPLAFGGSAGIGLRYFITPFLALGAELGEGYASIPFDSSVTRSERLSAFATWGSLAALLVF
jgi:hypothetical protein